MNPSERTVTMALVDRLVASGRAHAMKCVLHASRPEVISKADLEAARRDYDVARKALELFMNEASG